MKTKLIMALLACALMTGCDNAYSDGKRRQTILDETRSSEIQTMPGNPTAYIVRMSDGSIWFMQGATGSYAISSKTQLFPPPAK